MVYGITLIILGLLAFPSLIISKKPNARELFDRIAPFQGRIGVIFALWGLWGIIDAVLHLSILGPLQYIG